MAWGAEACLAFGLGPSVIELLLRRFVTRYLRLDVLDIWRTFLLNAEAAANAMLWVMLFGRRGGCRRRSAETGPACDGEEIGNPRQLHASEHVGRRAVATPPLEALHAAIPALQNGAPCVPRPSSPTERLTAAPMASPTFLFIIFADATWSKPAVVAMQTLGCRPKCWGGVVERSRCAFQ